MLSINYLLEQTKLHAGILARGLVRTLYGAMVAGLIGVAVYGFIKLGGETGYSAVMDFIASLATLVVALSNAYAMGRKKRGAKK